ncbi:hypothetical protein DXB25_22870 [Lachnospiraceae bacterium OM02-31]|nr:hypothetical protein DXB25_22870 [Lachnospiraceae bacterium OM02-31]RJW51127.1 hypothetical protein DXB24_30240 [Lachnospiraceae bacterium OM02-3]
MGSSDRPLRAAVFRQNKPLRNITVFSHGEGNTYSTAAGSKKDGGRERRRGGRGGGWNRQVMVKCGGKDRV